MPILRLSRLVLRFAISIALLTVRNLRNFAYRSEPDFTERWETRTCDLYLLTL